MIDRLKCAILSALVVFAAGAQALAAEKRVALVIGNGSYEAKPLETAANDAGLVAQTLQAAGFDVTGARDLDEDSLRHAFRDFSDKVAASGPDTVAFVYFSGYGLQLEGENYVVPIGANIARDADIPSRATRVSDYVKSLAGSGVKTAVVVLDAARPSPFTFAGAPLASGLALQDPGPRTILAFNAAPGSVAPVEKGPYGAYAHALSEMIREGGLPVKEVFERVRLRVNETTKGAEIPWNSPGADTSLVFFERSANAPPAPDQTASINKPIAELGPKDGYSAAIQRDTLQGYEDYVASYPTDPSARRVRALLAVRREAITWRRTRVADSPNAYWSYLRRYPRGPHVGDARRRLAELAVAYDPPPSFEIIDYDVPPPPPEEIIYVDRPVIVFDDPVFGFAPPPPPPVYFLPPPPPDFVVLPPPVIIAEPYALPVPVFVPIPVWQRPPPYIAPPPNNVIFENIHNQVIVDNAANNFVVKDHGGQLLSSGALKAAGVGAAALAVGAALPAFVAKKAAVAPPAGPGAPPPGGGVVNPAALHTPPGAQNLAPGQFPPGAPPLAPHAPGVVPGANPAATLHTPPNASPLPTPGAQPPGKGLSAAPPAGAGAPGAPPAATGAQGANPAASLHTPPNASPLPTPGAQPPGKGLSAAPPAGAGASSAPPAVTGAQGANPAASLHTPPNASPLPTPPGGGQPLDKGLPGKSRFGTGAPGAPSAPGAPAAPGANPAASLHTLPNASPLPTPPGGEKGLKSMSPAGAGVPPGGVAPGRAPRVNAPPVAHAPALNVPPSGPPTGVAPRMPPQPSAPSFRHQQAPVMHAPAMHAPPPAVRSAPPPAAAIHQPPPQFRQPPPQFRQGPPPGMMAPRQGPPPGMAMPRQGPPPGMAPPRQMPPPQVMRAPPAPAFHAPPPQMRAPAPAPAAAKHCAILNGVPVCR